MTRADCDVLEKNGLLEPETFELIEGDLLGCGQCSEINLWLLEARKAHPSRLEAWGEGFRRLLLPKLTYGRLSF